LSLLSYICRHNKQNKLKKFFRSKWFKIPFYTFLVGFALIGFFLTASYVAIKFRFTDEKGSVDVNDRYFHEIRDKYDQSFKKDTSSVNFDHYEALQRILLLNRFYPKNAQHIMHAYKNSEDDREVLRMLDAADIQLKKNKYYMSQLYKLKYELKKERKIRTESIYDWMNISEWQDFKIAVAKDTHLIDSVAKVTGVEARLIVACLVGEQIRLFNSNREAYKKWIGPLKVLSVESQFSFGVTGIKEHTAQKIEGYLKNPSSEYYLGAKYENLLDFNTADTTKERLDRLTSYRNHFYSYMYAAVFLKQVKVQWEREGFPIENRPEILATLFNVGFPQSKPKSNPKVGGSTIKIYEKPYTFGAIAFQFYYSGELFELFPIQTKKFDWDEKV
jgi:hypothetical protein